jgi:hypothetical protein
VKYGLDAALKRRSSTAAQEFVVARRGSSSLMGTCALLNTGSNCHLVTFDIAPGCDLRNSSKYLRSDDE